MRTYHLVLVIAPLRIFKMAANENSKSLHVFHVSHIVLPSEAKCAYHHNFGLHVNICMIFCVLMASCIINYAKCEYPTSIPSPWHGKTGNGAIHVYYRHTTFLTQHATAVHLEWEVHIRGPLCPWEQELS